MKSKVITLSIPAKLLKEIDRAARREGRTRSELLREGCRKYIEDTARWQYLREVGQRALKNTGIQSEEELYDKMTQWRREEAKQEKRRKSTGRSRR